MDRIKLPFKACLVVGSNPKNLIQFSELSEMKAKLLAIDNDSTVHINDKSRLKGHLNKVFVKELLNKYSFLSDDDNRFLDLDELRSLIGSKAQWKSTCRRLNNDIDPFFAAEKTTTEDKDSKISNTSEMDQDFEYDSMSGIDHFDNVSENSARAFAATVTIGTSEVGLCGFKMVVENCKASASEVAFAVAGFLWTQQSPVSQVDKAGSSSKGFPGIYKNL